MHKWDLSATDSGMMNTDVRFLTTEAKQIRVVHRSGRPAGRAGSSPMLN